MSHPPTSSSAAQDIVATAEQAGAFSTFLKALGDADLVKTLQDAQALTVFAPTDAAFDKLPSSMMKKLMQPEHKQLLRALLSYHVAEGQVGTRLLKGKRIRAKSFEGSLLLINGADGIVVSGARVTAPDIEASNGVIHGVDRVLCPKSLMASLSEGSPRA